MLQQKRTIAGGVTVAGSGRPSRRRHVLGGIAAVLSMVYGGGLLASSAIAGGDPTTERLVAGVPVNGDQVEGMPGAAEFRTVCQSCHLEGLDGAGASTTLAAPPMDEIAALESRKWGGDRDMVVGAMVSYLLTPSASRSVLSEAELRQWSPMPPIHAIRPDLTLDQLKAVSGWIFDYYDTEGAPAERNKIVR